MTTLDYGRVRCPKCGTWYGLDETHVCATASIQIDPAAANPTTVPDLDRPHPAGLTWVSPLTPRPIVLGPSADHAELHPALDLAADRFWSSARHGLAVGHARLEMDAAAMAYALSASPQASPHLAVAMAEAADVWTHATTSAARDLFGATA